MKKTASIASIAEQVLAEAERAEQVKTAEAAALREAARPSRGELGTLFHKLAEDLRSEPEDVTYDDLRRHLAGGDA